MADGCKDAAATADHDPNMHGLVDCEVRLNYERPAELHRVFPPGAELATDVSPIVSLKRDPTELERAEAASMQEQIERLFEVGRQIRKELDDAATPSTPPLAPA